MSTKAPSRKQVNHWKGPCGITIEQERDGIAGLIDLERAVGGDRRGPGRLGVDFDALIDQIDDPVTRDIAAGIDARLVTLIAEQRGIATSINRPMSAGPGWRVS